MSAKGRHVAGYEPEASDFYATPYWATRAILPFVVPSVADGGSPVVMDPFAGEGAILDVCKEKGCTTVGIELNVRRALVARGLHNIHDGNAFAMTWPKVDAVVTNPPYSMAVDAVTAGLQYSESHRVDVAYLLRLGFLGSQERADFHKKHPCDFFLLPRRPQYVCSVSCSKKKTGCQWGERIAYLPTGQLSAPVPEHCPTCSAATVSSSSDASEYAWFVWGPNRGGRWSILDVESARPAVTNDQQVGLFGGT